MANSPLGRYTRHLESARWKNRERTSISGERLPVPARYSEFNSTKRLLGLITRERMLESLSAMASWLGEARNAARGKGVGYRDIVYYADGTHQWLYPHSNAGEQINVFLWLHDLLGDERCLQHAIEYADIAISDPIHGIYRGEHTEAHGLPWYWPDIGVYGSIYGMRFPGGFHALFQRTGKPIFEKYTHLTAAPLLARQTKIGLIDAGWSPQKKWAEGRNRINSRVEPLQFACDLVPTARSARPITPRPARYWIHPSKTISWGTS